MLVTSPEIVYVIFSQQLWDIFPSKKNELLGIP